jgi:hypothetical protein
MPTFEFRQEGNDGQLEALFRRELSTDADLSNFLTQDVFIPLLQIARSDASQAERRRQVDSLLEEWTVPDPAE